MTVGIGGWRPEPKPDINERLGAFIEEVASQATIIMMERHLGKFSDADKAKYKKHLEERFVALLKENNATLAEQLFGPQEVRSSDRNVSYYESAAMKLADIGETLWMKEKQP